MDTAEADTLGPRCRAAREEAGMSLATARDALRDAIPHRYVPSVKTLHRLERDEISEAKVDGLLIYGLARIYGKRISELSPIVAAEMETLSDLVVRSMRCITDPLASTAA